MDEPAATATVEPEPTFARVRELLVRPTPDSRQWVGAILVLALIGGSSMRLEGFLALALCFALRDLFQLAVMQALDVVDGRLLLLPLTRDAVPVGRPAEREAAVILSGSLFLMLLSLAAFIASRFGVPLTAELARASVSLAAFFLLPLKPYNGWRVLNLTLFSRWAKLEAVFGVLTSLGVVAIGFLLESWLIGAVGLLSAFGVSFAMNINRLADAFKAKAGPLGPVETGKLDEPTLRVLFAETRPSIEKLVTEQAKKRPDLAARTHANLMREVHARAARRVPSAGTAALVLIVYAVLVAYFIAGIFVVMAFSAPAAQ